MFVSAGPLVFEEMEEHPRHRICVVSASLLCYRYSEDEGVMGWLWVLLRGTTRNCTYPGGHSAILSSHIRTFGCTTMRLLLGEIGLYHTASKLS